MKKEAKRLGIGAIDVLAMIETANKLAGFKAFTPGTEFPCLVF